VTGGSFDARVSRSLDTLAAGGHRAALRVGPARRHHRL